MDRAGPWTFVHARGAVDGESALMQTHGKTRKIVPTPLNVLPSRWWISDLLRFVASCYYQRHTESVLDNGWSRRTPVTKISDGVQAPYSVACAMGGGVELGLLPYACCGCRLSGQDCNRVAGCREGSA